MVASSERLDVDQQSAAGCPVQKRTETQIKRKLVADLLGIHLSGLRCLELRARVRVGKSQAVHEILILDMETNGSWVTSL